MVSKSLPATIAIILQLTLQFTLQHHPTTQADAFSVQNARPTTPTTITSSTIPIIPIIPITPQRVDTTARKRTRQKSSYLKRQSNAKSNNLTNNNNNNTNTTTILPSTPDELHTLALSYSKRHPGSNSYRKGYIHWRTLALDAIRHRLSRNLPRDADIIQFENLFFRLGVASDVGRMPSFEDAGARSGYAVEFFCRARNLADLYVDVLNGGYEFPVGWREGLLDTPMLGGGGVSGDSDDGVSDGSVSGDDSGSIIGEAAMGKEEEPYSMVSLGGGPGFDYVGAALAASFSSYTSSSTTPTIKATILDYEEGWGDLVTAMANSTSQILHNNNNNQHSNQQTTKTTTPNENENNPPLQCTWGGKCDITKSIHDESNTAVLALVDTARLWTCQYCVAENANSLRDSDFVFWRELFRRAPAGCLFVLSEVHPRVWPEFYRSIEGMMEDCGSSGYAMAVGFNKNGRQMLLRKSSRLMDGDDGEKVVGSGVLISDKDRRLVEKFDELGRYHRRKIQSGWQRQAPKGRGGDD